VRVLILCAGDGIRWDNYLGVPKWLAPVDGVPILHRTVALLKERGVTDIRVVARPGDEQAAQVPGATVERARLDPNNYEADRFVSSRHLWSDQGRTLILYGDVYYTDNAMDTIVDDPAAGGEWRVYGRPKASKITGCTHGELFGFSWRPEHHAQVDDRLAYVIGLRRGGVINRALGWELFRALCGHTGASVRSPKGTPFDRIVKIDDWTDDFDKPKNYDTWIYRRSDARRRVAVLVPWRPDDGPRDAAWAWLRERWRRKHPDWQIIEGHCPDGEWSKGAAVADALARTDALILVIADADVWCGGTPEAVDKVAIGQARWAVPHRLVHRLSEQATADLTAGALSYERIHRAELAERPYVGYAGGGITVIDRDLLARAPIDPRFVGWGHEDEAAALAWCSLAGRPWRGAADLWHLWHPPQQRPTRAAGSAENQRLLRAYQSAARHPEAMRKILAAADGSLSPLPKQPARGVTSMRFISEKYPELHIPTVGVRFREGVADVTTRGAVAYLQTPQMRRRGVRRADASDVAAPAAGQPVQVTEPAPLNTPEPEPEPESVEAGDAAPEPSPDDENDAPDPAAEQDGDDPADSDLPAGTAADVLAWVGDDPTRAAEALAAEHGSDKPRSTLIARLEKVGG